MTTSSELQVKIEQWVNEHADDVLQLTEALIRFQSEQRVPTGWEKEAQMFVAETLRGMKVRTGYF